MLSRLRSHAEKLVNCSIVASILESPQFRATLLEVRASALRLFTLSIYEALQALSRFRTADFQIALKKDEDEMSTLLQALLESTDEMSAARSLRGEQAKSFMRILKQARVHIRLVISAV